MAKPKTIEDRAQGQIAVIETLMAERATLVAELEENGAALEGAVTQASSRSNENRKRRSDGRIVSDMSLGLRLANILIDNDNESMTIGELTEVAVKQGWRTSSDLPRSIVTQAVNQDDDFIGKGKMRSKRWKLSAGALARLS